MAWNRFQPTRGGVFTLLLALSAIALFLPPAWTDSLKHVAQLLVPASDLARSAGDVALQPLRSTASGMDAAGDTEALIRELASERALTAQLREENDRLRALRDQQLPPAIPLLDAKIIARDVALWRDAMLVARGSTRGVRRHDWVASRLFVNRGRASGVDEGQAVLARQCLLGVVEQVSPYMSRVQLLSDIDSPRVEVRVARVNKGRVQLFDYACSLRGAGRGRMTIENVEAQYVQPEAAEPEGKPMRISVGDLVLTAPGQLGLPLPLTIGRIAAIEENPSKRLVYHLSVEPLVDMGELRDVFIVPIVPPEPNTAP
ncbi:MAG TPA: rod shape-determining protein MreC [Phycisphaerae bacterium]|nr:rod shape-determining protein MreC [Phycisphaerae bacterium]